MKDTEHTAKDVEGAINELLSHVPEGWDLERILSAVVMQSLDIVRSASEPFSDEKMAKLAVNTVLMMRLVIEHKEAEQITEITNLITILFGDEVDPREML